VTLDRSGRDRLVDAVRAALEARPEIAFAYLHGSFAGDGPYRDVDVAVWVDAECVPRSAWVRYGLQLATDLQPALPVRLDVQVLNGASLSFRYHAMRGRLLFARDAEAEADVRARTWDDYFDFEPFARAYLREALRGGSGHLQSPGVATRQPQPRRLCRLHDRPRRARCPVTRARAAARAHGLRAHIDRRP
jgi:predicted nucleotidyltransferase